jgi:sugar phosphate isomerase/epimerase
VQRTKAAVDLAVALECPFVRVFAFELPPGEKRTRGIDRIAQRLSDALAYCRNSGVRLAIENGGSFSTAAELAELIDAVGNPLLASCYSIPVGIAAGDYPVRGVNVLADTLEMVKVKDLRDGKPCALGQGSIDSRPALAALAQLSFTGWVVYEYDRAWLPAGRSEDVAKVLESSAATLYSWIGPKAISSRPAGAGGARGSRMTPPGRA